MKGSEEPLVAIDVVLAPDQAMVDQATALNARLRENDPTGYVLDATHPPHVTLVQRYVRARDLEAVEAVVGRVLAVERPSALRLNATGIDYTMSAGSAVTTIVIERTPELMRLHQKMVDAIAPFSVDAGTAPAFAGSDIDSETLAYVETFVPKASGAAYVPHVTVGVAKEDFVKRMKAEPFKAFTANVSGVAIYQLGAFGIAARKLWEQRSEPLAP
jgi:hypothetical protein